MPQKFMYQQRTLQAACGKRYVTEILIIQGL